MVLGLTCKLGRAWVGAWEVHGALHVHGMIHGCLVGWCGGGNHME